MTAIASPEFIALCRAQLKLLTQTLETSSAALYIADVASKGNKQPDFVPVVSYPEPVESWVANFEAASAASSEEMTGPLALPAADGTLGTLVNFGTHQESTFQWPDVLHPEQRLVTPLVYTDVVVGLLVAVRSDRAWNHEEREHIEAIGASLAGGCVLERRNQWLQGQLAHKRGLQSRQSEVFHNLLHQFRNPLTAVSTFGQLLVKRLGPEDPSAPIATGIVRENKRLRELVSHFDEAVAIGDADLAADRTVSLPLLEPQPSRLSSANALEPDEVSTAAYSLGGRDPHERDPSSADSHEGGADSASATVETSHGLGQPLVLSAQHLPDIVEPVLAVANIVAAEKGVQIQAQVATDTPTVWGEEEALGEVVTNLIDNAIKYSPSGAMVWVQTGVSRDAQADLAVGGVGGAFQGIVVGDTGPGIPATDIPHLFERNYRGVQAQSDIPGTGLGLAIAQSLVQEMHGYIEVISPAVGSPWLPTRSSSASDSLETGKEGDRDGAGTVFVVWLREVDHVANALAD